MPVLFALILSLIETFKTDVTELFYSFKFKFNIFIRILQFMF